MSKGSKRRRPVPQPRTARSSHPAGDRRPGQGSPWSPVAVFAWALLGGPLYGGVFAYLNTRRLGMREYEIPTILMAGLGWGAPIILRVYVLHVPPVSPAGWNIGLLARVIAAYYFSITQREAYWTHTDSGGPTAGGLWPSVFAVLIFAIQIIFAFRP